MQTGIIRTWIFKMQARRCGLFFDKAFRFTRVRAALLQWVYANCRATGLRPCRFPDIDACCNNPTARIFPITVEPKGDDGFNMDKTVECWKCNARFRTQKFGWHSQQYRVRDRNKGQCRLVADI